MLRTFSCFILGSLTLGGLALAQSQVGGGTLNGTVTDPTGSAIPGAKLSITNTDTGLARAAETNSAGLYSFPLPAGTYELSVTANGFKNAKLPGIPLGVGAVGPPPPS